MMDEPTLSNSEAMEIAAIKDAKAAIHKIAKADGNSVEGWLAYGSALNVLRELHLSDRDFGKAVDKAGLGALPALAAAKASAKINPNDRIAAMWGAGSPDQLERAKTLGGAGKTRTLRGFHVLFMAHVKDTAAARALHEIEDGPEADAAVRTVAEETGLPEQALAEARVKLAKADQRKAAKEAAEDTADVVQIDIGTPAGLAAVLDTIVARAEFAAARGEISALREALDTLASNQPAAPEKPKGRKAKPVLEDADVLH